MPGRPRRRDVCWTCRIRRKKCDGVYPVCQSCFSLEIPCQNSRAKPDWMDGGPKQKAKALEITAHVKDRANHRRERSAGGNANFIITAPSQYDCRSESQESRVLTTTGAASFPSNTSRTSGPLPLPSEAAIPEPILVPSMGHMVEHSAIQPTGSLGKAWELDFTMMYLDYVFPFLFPFYRPPLTGTGRSWLLSFVKSNRAVWHSVLGLTAFFFTFGLRDVLPGQEDGCRSVHWNQVVEHAKMSFEMLHTDLVDISRPERKASLLEKGRMMGTIIHLMVFDLFVGRSSDWLVHLPPAVTLFEEIIAEASRLSPDKSGLDCVLEHMQWPRPVFPGFERQLWNPDQASFRFFAAILFFIDIIGGTSLQRAPQLHCYHSEIIDDLGVELIDSPLDLFAFVGCQNWALLAIGDIAALDAWKKETKKSGEFKQPAFTARAVVIQKTLQQGFQALDQAVASVCSISDGKIDRLQPYFQDGTHKTGSGSSTIATRIWAHAAHVYLHTTVSGWAPSNEDVCWHVTQISRLAKSLESVAQIRTLAWPICVGGCLADEPDQQQEFRDVINMVGSVQLRSAVCEAGRIMEEVWKRRSALTLDADTWDVASCLRALGTPSLLV